jgi:hypothetical protein
VELIRGLGRNVITSEEQRTMRCEQIRRELHEAHRPEEPLSPGIQAHLDRCLRCRAAHLELVALRRSLSGLEAPALPGGFELALRQRLRDVQRARVAELSSSAPARRRSVLLPVALVASVLLAIGAVTGLVVTRLGGSDGAEQSAQHYSLQLSIQTTHDHPEALFDVQLPHGVALTSAAASSLGKGTPVQWRSQLRAGRNEVELPLVVREPGAVRVEIHVGGRSLATTVHLSAQAAASGRPIVVAWTLDGGEPTEVVQ